MNYKGKTALIDRLDESSLRRNVFLYVYSLIMLSTYLPYISDVIDYIVIFLALVSSVAALIVLGKQFNDILKFPGGLVLPKQRFAKFTTYILLVIFSVWLLTVPFTVLSWFDMGMLSRAAHLPRSVGNAFLNALIIAPFQEIQRWASMFTLYYIGSGIIRKHYRRYYLWVIVGLGSLYLGFFGGQGYPDYRLQAWLAFTCFGFLLLFIAFWGKSFWLELITLVIYQLLTSLPLSTIEISMFRWRNWLFVPIFALIITYYIWHNRRRKINS